LNRMIPIFSAIISAAILGVAMMLLTFLLFTPAYQVTRTERFSTDSDEEVKAAQTMGISDVGIVTFPSSLIHAGLVIIFGLLIAFGTSLCTKKRVLPTRVKE